MSINIVKGVEFGLGFEQTRRFGSAVHDVIEGRGEGGRWIHRSNNAGGLTGGVTNGEPLVVRGAVKPISTLARPLPSADLVTGEAVDKAHYERSDISVVPAAGVVGEAMVMLTLADAMLDKFGGDTIGRHPRRARPLRRADLAGVPAPVAGGAGAARAATGAVAAATRPAPAATTRRGRLTDGRRPRRAARAAARAPSGGGSPIATAPTFVDLDESIEKAAGRPIPEIFAERRRGGVPGPRARRRSRRSGRPTADPAVRTGRSRPAAAPSSTRATAGRCTAAALPIWLDVRPGGPRPAPPAQSRTSGR